MNIEERKFRFFQALIDCSFGTLWHVDEQFWYAHLANYCSNRNWHPGFSILKKTEENNFHPAIPILFGTSSRSGCNFVVKGVTRKKGPEHRTYFGTIEKPIPQAAIGDFFGTEPLISVNEDKPRATQTEIAKAEAFLKNNCRRRKQNG